MNVINRLIATLVLILSTIVSVIVFVESKDFCEEYVRNDNNIDFGFRFIGRTVLEYDYDYLKYFFIGNTFWKLDFHDFNITVKNVIINTESVGQSDWLSGEKYSMAWCVSYNATNLPILPGIKVDHCRVGALKKDLKTIDSAVLNAKTFNINQSISTSTIAFETNFQPLLAWVPMPCQTTYRIVTFMSTTGQMKSFNFWDPNNPNEDLPIDTNHPQRPIISGDQEKQINSQYPIRTIMAQYSFKDCGANCLENQNGQGSIVFMNVNKTIQYCYVGKPYIECKPKTLIDCSDTIISPTTVATDRLIKILTILLIIVGVVVVIIFSVAIIVCIFRFSGRGDGNTDNTSKSGISGKSSKSRSKKKSTSTKRLSITGSQSKETNSKTDHSTDPSKGNISKIFGPIKVKTSTKPSTSQTK